jgi:hypothetical protein
MGAGGDFFTLFLSSSLDKFVRNVARSTHEFSFMDRVHKEDVKVKFNLLQFSNHYVPLHEDV